jgi:hypothetical protein
MRPILKAATKRTSMTVGNLMINQKVAQVTPADAVDIYLCDVCR